MQILLIVIAALGPVIAVIFGCHALWRLMATLYGAPAASAVLAAVWLGAASLSAITLLVLQARRRRRKAAIAAAAAATPPRSDLAAALSVLPGGLGDSAPRVLAALELAMARKPLQTTALLVGFGAILGRRPGALLRLLREAEAR